MATTTVEILLEPGTAKVYAYALGGSGTPAASYTPSQVAGHVHTIAVPEALTGRWLFSSAKTSTGRGWGRIIREMVDQTTTFYLTVNEAVSMTVTPVQGSLPSSVKGTTISVFKGETKTISVAVVDGDGNAVDVSAMTLELVIENRAKTDRIVIDDGSITKVTSTISFDVPALASTVIGDSNWSLRQTVDNSVVMHGVWSVKYAAIED